VSLPRTQTPAARSDGFTILELIFALVIFAVGSLALAGLSVTLEQQTTSTNLRTERSAAITTALERIRAADFDSVASGTDSIGHYRTTWTVTDAGSYAKRVTLVTEGPAYRNSGGSWVLALSVPDTILYQVTAP
jgi:prepilin-type N-terminal cleavage/methylation domain-containing protein